MHEDFLVPVLGRLSCKGDVLMTKAVFLVGGMALLMPSPSSSNSSMFRLAYLLEDETFEV